MAASNIMWSLLFALTSSLYFPCSGCLGEQWRSSLEVKTETLKLQSTIPLLKSSCKSGEWTNIIDKNRWISKAGILVKIIEKATYKTIPFSRFWESQNALEARTILAKLAPGKEKNVIEYHLRVAEPWGSYEYASPGKCPKGLDCHSPPYPIHYLHRPEKDWVIDLLSSHAEGFVFNVNENGEVAFDFGLIGPFLPFIKVGSDFYAIIAGPYRPVYEGSFKHQGHRFWFSAREVEPNINLSTPEMRYEAFKSINELVTCLTIKE